MNAKAKKVIAAYAKAVKHAHKPDSRIRLMFIGDSAAGENHVCVLYTVVTQLHIYKCIIL